MAIQKIQGEQPFQVLATNFSIGPSNEGYTLQISANGNDYSDLFSVGANVTRMVTGVANGSYYRLSGNNSEVSINWRTQCNDGGSGGGSGSGSTVSVNQILSAGTEIAQISVDGVPTSLYAPEGGEGGDYMVVSELPASAEEGQLFYVPEHIQTTTYSGTALDCSAISEGFCFWVKRISDNNEIVTVYRSGTDFHWGWTNDGEYHMKTDAEVPIRYQTDNANGIFNIWVLGEGYYLDLTSDVASAATADYSYSVTVADTTYRYLDNQFVMEPAAITYNVSSGTTVAEWTALYNKLLIMTEEQRANVSLLYIGDRILPSTDNGTYVKFLYNEFVADIFYFNGIAQSFGGSAEYTAPVAAKIAIRSGDAPSITWSQLTVGLNIEVDPSTHNLSLYSRDYTWFSIFRTLAKPTENDIPVAVKLNYKRKHFNATTISDANEAFIALNEVYDGVRYEAEWRLVNDNQAPTLLYWKESPVYQIVSSLTDVGVNTVTFEDSKLTLPQSFITSLTGETDLLIYGGYPEDASNIPIKLTSDGTNVNMYWGEQYNTGGTYTFVASGACANGTTIVYNNQGDFTCAISTSGSDYVFTLSSPWGDVAPSPFYIAEVISYTEGQLVYTKDTHKLQVYDDDGWNEVGAGGGDGLVHLETLSGATGETNVVYECDDELFWWNENAGNIGKWIIPFYRGSNNANTTAIFRYSAVDEITTLVSGTSFTIKIDTNRDILFSSTTVSADTVAVGETKDLYYASYSYISVKNEGNNVHIYNAKDTHLTVKYVFDGAVASPHWELASKDCLPLPKVFTTAQDTAAKIPVVKQQEGYIVGWDIAAKRTFKLNGSGIGSYWNAGYTGEISFYAPSTSGTVGQVLTSNGNAEPQWATMIKAVQITSADYEALATKDANTLYLIVDE